MSWTFQKYVSCVLKSKKPVKIQVSFILLGGHPWASWYSWWWSGSLESPLMASIWPKNSKNVAYMCHEKQNTYQVWGLLYPTPFLGPFQTQRQDLKVCGERSWLPISKMVWHFTIGLAVWKLELVLASRILAKMVCHVGCQKKKNWVSANCAGRVME